MRAKNRFNGLSSWKKILIGLCVFFGIVGIGGIVIMLVGKEYWGKDMTPSRPTRATNLDKPILIKHRTNSFNETGDFSSRQMSDSDREQSLPNKPTPKAKRAQQAGTKRYGKQKKGTFQDKITARHGNPRSLLHSKFNAPSRGRTGPARKKARKHQRHNSSNDDSNNNGSRESYDGSSGGNSNENNGNHDCSDGGSSDGNNHSGRLHSRNCLRKSKHRSKNKAAHSCRRSHARKLHRKVQMIGIENLLGKAGKRSGKIQEPFVDSPPSYRLVKRSYSSDSQEANDYFGDCSSSDSDKDDLWEGYSDSEEEACDCRVCRKDRNKKPLKQRKPSCSKHFAKKRLVNFKTKHLHYKHSNERSSSNSPFHKPRKQVGEYRQTAKEPTKIKVKHRQNFALDRGKWKGKRKGAAKYSDSSDSDCKIIDNLGGRVNAENLRAPYAIEQLLTKHPNLSTDVPPPPQNYRSQSGIPLFKTYQERLEWYEKNFGLNFASVPPAYHQYHNEFQRQIRHHPDKRNGPDPELFKEWEELINNSTGYNNELDIKRVMHRDRVQLHNNSLKEKLNQQLGLDKSQQKETNKRVSFSLLPEQLSSHHLLNQSQASPPHADLTDNPVETFDREGQSSNLDKSQTSNARSLQKATSWFGSGSNSFSTNLSKPKETNPPPPLLEPTPCERAVQKDQPGIQENFLRRTLEEMMANLKSDLIKIVSSGSNNSSDEKLKSATGGKGNHPTLGMTQTSLPASCSKSTSTGTVRKN